jgi:L-threonylcarbamoyladenylate synthase
VAPAEVLLAFGRDVPAGARLTINLSPSGNLEEAAARLFAAMRELDQAGAAAIAVMPIPAQGLGEAINDRLQRAANRR